MRIVSLLPSATEMICALGLRDQLVGISHRCDFPPEIEGVAVVTCAEPTGAIAAVGSEAAAAPAMGRFPGGAGVDDEVGPGRIDRDLLLAVEPDLVIVGQRDSGLGSREMEAALVGMDVSPEIVCLDPMTLEGIFHSLVTLGAMTETEDNAIELLEALREGLGSTEQAVVVRHDQGIRPKRVVVLGGLSPLRAGGRWIPEQVRRAGGWELLGREGEQSSPTSWEAIRDVDPEMLLLAPSGLTLLQAQAVWRRAERPEFWDDLEAVRCGHVFFVEPVYFYRPGPRVVDGVAMLAEIFDPEGFIDTSPPGSWAPLAE